MTRPKIHVVRKARRLIKNKFKVSKSFSKRFSFNSNGLLKANSSGRRHNASNRHPSQHLSSKGTFTLSHSNVKAARRMIGLKASFVSHEYNAPKVNICSKRVSRFIGLLKQCQE